MVENVFEYDMIAGSDRPTSDECGDAIGRWLWDQSEAGKAYRAVVRLEPIERVKWPWPDDLKRVRVGPAIAQSNVSSGFGRTISLLSVGLQYLGTVDMNALGVWPYNQSRIAENDNGFVRLSEVEDGKN